MYIGMAVTKTYLSRTRESKTCEIVTFSERYFLKKISTFFLPQ